MKYFAYGMNTNINSMAMRCPSATLLGTVILPHYKFGFKSFATVIPDMDAKTHGVLWEITPNCERSLDHLEGYPTFYNKINVMVWHEGELTPAMTYLMYPEEESAGPSNSYWDMLVQGYKENGISLDQLNQAINEIDSTDKFWLTNRIRGSIIHSSW